MASSFNKKRRFLAAGQSLGMWKVFQERWVDCRWSGQMGRVITNYILVLWIVRLFHNFSSVNSHQNYNWSFDQCFHLLQFLSLCCENDNKRSRNLLLMGVSFISLSQSVTKNSDCFLACLTCCCVKKSWSHFSAIFFCPVDRQKTPQKQRRAGFYDNVIIGSQLQTLLRLLNCHL